MTAEGGTRALHMVNIGRSKSPWGPFESCPQNPILAEHRIYQTIRATGHADLIEAHDGSLWMVFLATRHYNYDATSYIGRETFMAPVQWVDGWPIPDASVTKNLNVAKITLPKKPFEISSDRDEFNQTTLSYCWNFLRNPLEGSCSLSAKPGSLVLQGNKYSLNEIASPAWVGRRQEHFNCTIETKLGFTATSDNDESRLTIYQNFQHHYNFALTRRNKSQSLVIRKTVGDLFYETSLIPIKSESVFLKIQANKDHYTMSYSIDGQNTNRQEQPFRNTSAPSSQARLPVFILPCMQAEMASHVKTDPCLNISSILGLTIFIQSRF